MAMQAHAESPGDSLMDGRVAAAFDDDVRFDHETLLERIPAVTYVAGFGESGRWHYVSSYIEELLGFTVDEWMADPHIWFRQIYPQDRARALEEEAQSKASGDPLDSEYLIMKRLFITGGAGFIGSAFIRRVNLLPACHLRCTRRTRGDAHV